MSQDIYNLVFMDIDILELFAISIFAYTIHKWKEEFLNASI
ncbi:38450_t:CDS:2, partial [Gigaspora margarita]